MSKSWAEMTRTVTIKVSNRTQDITLDYPRIYLHGGRCSVPSDPEVPPGCSTTCEFSSSSSPGCSGVLSFWAKTCTLVIFFSNPLEDDKSPRELGLELSPHRKVCRLKDLYEEMSGRDPKLVTKDSNFERVALDICQDSIWKTQGPLNVMATMLNARNAVVSVAVRGFK
ncbi:uncharacterized protein LOC113941084 isoform X2 [Corapipo altera]|uniref:uncharacterized protein LOC113941084 isoform X2 n=1 Tax=Corapipo altera TaxID=415028 RepID=UPI000FD68A46|nr:uncharacterized protein LOC113941084 isoform X2 [Corapipo altera]